MLIMQSAQTYSVLGTISFSLAGTKEKDLQKRLRGLRGPTVGAYVSAVAVEEERTVFLKYDELSWSPR